MERRQLRVGIVDYLNSWPLAWSFLTDKHDSRFKPEFHPPATLAARLQAGELEVALIPSIEALRIPGVRILPDLCVASDSEVRSVLLVSQRPIDQIRRVCLDTNSRTSAALVEILLRERYGLDPMLRPAAANLDEMLAGSDAALLIGDPALQVDRDRYYVYDLAREWRRWTDLPFVFALWAVRPGVDDGDLLQPFVDSLESGLTEIEAVVDRAAGLQKLDRQTLYAYFTENLSYRLGARELAGLEAFFARACRLTLAPPPPRVRFWQPPETPN